MFKNIGSFESSFRINPYQTHSGDYYAPGLHRLTLIQNQSIQYQGPIVWEEIPLPIRQCPSLASFKYNYRSYLISGYNET